MCARYYRRSDKRRIAETFRFGVPPTLDILPVDLLKPFPAEEMTSWKVSAAVGNVRNNSPQLIDSC
jgi:hypothetical protein